MIAVSSPKSPESLQLHVPDRQPLTSPRLDTAQITPLILTFNEAPNIRQTLQRLTWARRIVVVDSFSQDTTVSILKEFPQVTLLQRAFDNHTSQWNFGLANVATEWVLSLDADYIVPKDLGQELESLEPTPSISAYYAAFRYCVFGKPLRGSLYPPRAILFRKNSCRYEQDGHTQLLCVRGETRSLSSVILHEDKKGLSTWLESQNRYAELEAAKLLRAPASELGLADKIRRWILFAPALVFLYTLLGKRLILDGWQGWYYVFQRTLAEMLLSLHLLEARFK